jgi:Cu(I)/Ag(I) efflux system membrane fusion protein
MAGLGLVAILAFVMGAVLFGDGGEAPPGSEMEHDHAADVSAKPTMWTCSMHPQIKLPKEGKCPICFMDLIPLDSGSGDELGPRQLRLSESAKQLAQIQTVPARRTAAEAEVRMAGKITYDETRLAYITAWVPGRLDRLYADFTGIAVAKGDRLVKIYSPELLASQEELIQAQSAVAALNNSSSAVLLSTARATIDAVREKLRLMGLTAAQIASIEKTRKTSEHLTIYSPIGGVVVHKDATEGMYVATGTRIYTIADLSKLWIIFEAYESYLPLLRYGQKIVFTSLSFPGEQFEAVISFIDPFVDAKTRTVKVRGVVVNEQRRLKPDMFVSGVVKSRIDGDDSDDETAPLLIPASAPLITGKRAVVYVEIPNDEGPLFEGREVDLGPRAGDFYVIKSGIMEGENIVTNGAFKIDSELQIRAKPSMMSPQGSAQISGHQHGTQLKAAVQAPHKEETIVPLREERKALEALAPVYDAYFAIHMGLAKDDLESVTAAGKKLLASVDNVDMSIFSHEGHARWMAASKKMNGLTKKLAAAGDIESARDSFYYLSLEMIGLHKSFGHSRNDSYYLGHCPMAKDGAGANWLQKEDIVWNPFYGSKMLRCGTATLIDKPGSGEKK